MAKYQLVKGTTSQTVEVFIQDSSSTTGAGLTGLAFNTASLTAFFYREGDASTTSMTLVTMTLGTWVTLGFVVVDATNMPGVYQIGIPDAALATGADYVNITLRGASNMVDLHLEIQLSNFDVNVDIEDTIWDESVLVHLTEDTMGRFLKDTVMRADDNAQAGSNSPPSITLNASAVNTDDLYNGAIIHLTAGTGEAQARVIIDYTGSTRVCLVDRAWAVIPDTTTDYAIRPASPLAALSDVTPFQGADIAATLARLPAALVSGRMDSNVEAINDNTAAAVRLSLSARGMIPGTVDNTAFTATTTILESDDITEDTADNFNGRNILWTSGIMIASMTDITDYALTGGRGRFTVSTMPETPGDNDTFIVI